MSYYIPISLWHYQSWNSGIKGFWVSLVIQSTQQNITHSFIFLFSLFFFFFSEHCEVNESTSSSTSALYINENDSSSNPQGKVRLPWLPKALQSSTISESDDVRWLRSRNVWYFVINISLLLVYYLHAQCSHYFWPYFTIFSHQ